MFLPDPQNWQVQSQKNKLNSCKTPCSPYATNNDKPPNLGSQRNCLRCGHTLPGMFKEPTQHQQASQCGLSFLKRAGPTQGQHATLRDGPVASPERPGEQKVPVHKTRREDISLFGYPRQCYPRLLFSHLRLRNLV